ncbi:MAG: pyruvate kinase [Candidatus Saccharibacteria bacterium]
MNNTFKRTKILATVGPAVMNPEKIDQMVEAGVNGFRLNCSHGTDEERHEQIGWIREAAEKYGRNVAILQDLQGPKIRLGAFDGVVEVKTGEEIVLDYSAPTKEGNVFPVQYNLAEKAKVGDPVFIFDGKVHTEVIEVVSSTAIKLLVKNDGILMQKKGINLPDTNFGGDVLTPKDIDNITVGANEDYDYVAMSFVQTADDVIAVKNRLRDLGSRAMVIAKVETKSAILEENLEAIVKASDGVMVARGDLAVEAGASVVPIVQRRIIELCRKYGRISIVATQMMASMVDSPEPTRAEVSDVATAVILGADTVMLSDETAGGKYPIETIKAMRDVILYTQDNINVDQVDVRVPEKSDIEDSISHAAVDLAATLKAKAIVAETKTGATAMSVAACRPTVEIYAITPDKRVAGQLALRYAVRSFVRPEGDKLGLLLAKEQKDKGMLGEAPARVVLVSGRQVGLSGGTDTIRVRVVE